MAWLYICLLVLYVIIMFVIIRRPMYEAVSTAFIFLCIITGNIKNISTYLLNASNTYLLFTITAFIAFSLIFKKTGIIDDLIDIIISVVGRFTGGAGYVALTASALMGSICGSAPGTAAAIGVTVIPTMKKTGFSPELAATIESSASCVGPLIPPSGAIAALYASIELLYPGQYSFSEFWALAWIVAFWFMLQRFITLYFIIRKDKVKPIPKEDRLPVMASIKKGWISIIVPIVIFVPFLIDALFKDKFITARLGTAASGFTAILLTVVPSVALFFTIMLYKRNGNKFSMQNYFNIFKNNISSIAPTIIVAYAGFAISELFNDMKIAEELFAYLSQIQFPLWFVAIIVPLVFTLLGMFIEPFSLILMFGGFFITMGVSVGIHPLLAAAMFNAMTCGLSPMTPPFALSQFICMGIAESDFKETSKKAIVWAICHYIVIVLCLFGLIPMFGILM